MKTTLLNLTTRERGEVLSETATSYVVLTESGKPAVWAKGRDVVVLS